MTEFQHPELNPTWFIQKIESTIESSQCDLIEIHVCIWQALSPAHQLRLRNFSKNVNKVLTIIDLSAFRTSGKAILIDVEYIRTIISHVLNRTPGRLITIDYDIWQQCLFTAGHESLGKQAARLGIRIKVGFLT